MVIKMLNNNSNKIGISVYPENSDVGEIKKYITLAKKYNYSRIFMSLLAADENNKDEIFKKFQDVCHYARDIGYEVILDVAPNIFDVYKIKYDNLSFFKDIGATGVRLDVGMDGAKESEMTFNQYDLDIELNISTSPTYLDSVMSFRPNKNRLVTCHNFYPQRLTGLSYELFFDQTKKAKKYGLRTAAFVTCKEGKIGPWKVNDRLPTIEEHRDMDIVSQAKYLIYSALVDDIIISNAFATEKELKELSEIRYDIIELRVKYRENIKKSEKKVIEEFIHQRRGDINDYNIRSTMSRIVYKDEDIVPYCNNELVKKGNLYINNSLFGHYKCEILIALKEQATDERKNKAGEIIDDEAGLLKFIESWTRFKIKEA
jgi:uncharacterized protein